MCCGKLPAAPESADLLAVIHPCTSNFTGKLRISNNRADKTISQFSQTGDDCLVVDGLTVQIHRYGFPIDIDMDNPIMHKFTIEGPSMTSCTDRLDLGVGHSGIIGRTVSVSTLDGSLLGQGIVGRI